MNLEEELSNIDLVRPGFGLLSTTPSNETYKQMLDSTRSKFSEIGDFYVIDDDPGEDKFYAICIVTYGNNTKIKINKPDYLKTDNLLIDNVFNMPDSSIFITINSRNPEILEGNFILKKFKITRKPKIGSGSKSYRAEITFSDKYYIDVFADSEQDAIQTAYETDISNWVHDWPNDPELDRNQTTRNSVWGKKMISVRTVNE